MRYEWNLPAPEPKPLTVTVDFPCKWCGETMRVTDGISEVHECPVYHTANEHFAYVIEQIRYRSEAEPDPEPCEYCSLMAGKTKEHDGSCDGMTKEQYDVLVDADETGPLPPFQ